MFQFLRQLWHRLCARLRFCGGVQYLAGTASLPSPLSPAEEKALLARMAAGEADARDALILHNLRLVVYLAKKYENSGVPAEDLISTSNRRQEAILDEPLNVDGDGNELLLSDILGSDENMVGQQLEQDAERAGLRRAVSSLSARERRIMELRFGLTDGVERTQKEAADALGISQSYISRLEKRIIQTLKLQLEGQ